MCRGLLVLAACLIVTLGCNVQPVAQSYVQVCKKAGTGLSCNVNSLTAVNLPLASGACGELGFDFNATLGFIPQKTIKFRVQFYDVYLLASLDQGRWGRNVTAYEGFSRCNCQGGENIECYSGFPATCTTVDLCAYRLPYAPNYRMCYDSGVLVAPCAGRQWHCGCVGEDLQDDIYWIAAVGGQHLYATISFDVFVGDVFFPGEKVTYLLDNAQSIALSNPVTGFSANISLNSFAIPDVGLAGLGAFVSKYREPTNAWMLSGVVLQTEKIPCDTPFWYSSLDMNNWFYWASDYESKIGYVPGDCFGNPPGYYTRNINYQVLADSMRVPFKVSSDYVFWNSTQGPSAWAKFNLTGVRSVQATISTLATDVFFIESFATVKLLSVGSVYTCLDGEAGFWVHYNNTGDSGLFTMTITSNGTTFQVGSVYTLTGVFNSTVSFPFANLEQHRACAVSTITSCMDFTPQCVSPYNPYPPNGNGGISGGGSGGAGLAWYWWLLIALVVIFLLVCTCGIIFKCVL